MKTHGYIDFADRGHVTGWARDEDQPDQSLTLVVTVDGELRGRIMANMMRGDLVDLGADGRLAFDFAFAEPLSPLRRAVIDVRGEVDGVSLTHCPYVIEPVTAFGEAKATIAGVLVSLTTDAEAEERLAFLAEQTEAVLRAKARLHEGAAERESRRRTRWRTADRVPDGEARSNRRTQAKRALVIDDRMPVTTRDAGSLAIVSHLLSLIRLGYAVDFVPADLVSAGASASLEGITVYGKPWYGSVEEVLACHHDVFDLVYVHRASNAAAYAPIVRRHQPHAHLVYAVADLGSLRLERQAAREQRPELLAYSRNEAAQEMFGCQSADAVVTHSTFEARILRARLPADKVHVVPFAVPQRDTHASFASRAGLAFIGGFEHSPNVDAAMWLAESIMPAVATRNPALQCLLVGSAMPASVRALGGPNIFPLGAVEDLGVIFERVRLTVAPLGFGAGVKGKVLESLAAGVPCACTSVAAEGLDLPEALSETIADDAEGLAAIILRLHEDEDFNRRCAEAGHAYVAVHASADAVDAALRAAVGL